MKVLVLTTFELDEYVFEALRAGASGFLVKHTEPAELIRAVRVVAAGEALLSPGVTRRLIAAFVDAASGPAATVPDRRLDRVADRPRARGGGAGRRGIVERGDRRPRWYVSHGDGAHPRQPGDDQVGARDRAQLVVFAYRNGSATIPTDYVSTSLFARRLTHSTRSSSMSGCAAPTCWRRPAKPARPPDQGPPPPDPPTET